MSNRERILNSALKLFNRSGSADITTNHIAQACNISPGNLYYHFRNKEQIIAQLFEQMISEWDEESTRLDLSQAPHIIIEQQLHMVFRYVWDYRFIHRELASLLQTDRRLKQRIQQVLKLRLQQVLQLIDFMITQEYLAPMNDTEKQLLADNILFYALFWQAYLDVMGRKLNRDNIATVIHVIQNSLSQHSHAKQRLS